MYGTMGAKDKEVIDTYLAQLCKGAVIVNLGCGPNMLRELNTLASSVGRYQYDSTLILADLDAHAIRNQWWAPGPEKVEVVRLNAATATTVLGKGRADLILALGLFGALDSTTTPEGTGKAAWPPVLRECLRLLKPLGKLIVSNSCDRQPFEEFRQAAAETGFTIPYHHTSPAASGWVKPGEQRYLIICEKPKRSRRSAV